MMHKLYGREPRRVAFGSSTGPRVCSTVAARRLTVPVFGLQPSSSGLRASSLGLWDCICASRGCAASKARSDSVLARVLEESDLQN